MAHYLGLHLDLFQRLVISPASVTVLRFAAPGHARLEHFNDTGVLPSFVEEQQKIP